MTQINTSVDINAFSFRGGLAMPRAITYLNQYIIFNGGLRMTVSGTQLFDMDGGDGRTYRLARQNNDWTLVGVVA